MKHRISNIEFVIFILTIGSLALGIIGWTSFYKTNGEILRLDFAIYKSLQLFFFNSSIGYEPIPLTLNIARFLSPFLLASAIIKQIANLTSKQKDAFKIRYLFKNHYIICGLGPVGYKIAEDCLKNGRKIVIIEKKHDKINIPEMVSKGAIVIVGDATDPLIIKKAGLRKAKVIFAVTDNDTTNMQISFLAKAIKLNSINEISKVEFNNKRHNKQFEKSNKYHLKSMVHITETSTSNLLFNSNYFQNTNPICYSRLFNINQICGKLVLDLFPPDIHIETRVKGIPTVNILIIGLGNIGENLLLNFARTCHYICNIPDGDKIISRPNTVHIVGTHANERMEEIAAIYPKLEKVVNCVIHNKKTMAFNMGDLSGLLKTNNIRSIYICLEDDVERFAVLQLIKEYQLRNQISVINLMPVNSNCEAIIKYDNSLLDNCNASNEPIIYNFNIIEQTCKHDILIDDKLDRVAKVLNSFDPKDDNMPDEETINNKWNTTKENFKQSSRYSAEHIKISIRALGLDWDKLNIKEIKEKIEDNPILVGDLANIEHIRFVAERFLDGWEVTTDEQNKLSKEELAKLKEKKINNTLIPYSKLTDGEKSYNNNKISKLHNLVELIKQNTT